jgi:hypothetical protein
MSTLRIYLYVLSCFFCFSASVAYALTLSSSDTVTITAYIADPNAPVVVPPTTPPSGGGGGGGGGGGVPLTTNGSGSDVVVFKGLAYPGSIVTLLKNGVILTELPASPDGTFEIHVNNLNPGTYSFGIRAEDNQHLRSTLDLYTVYISAGVTTVVDGIFIPPTITTDKLEVKAGDPVLLFGKSAPSANLTLSIHSGSEIVKKTKSDTSGGWLFKLDSNELELGNHEAKVRASTDTDISLYSSVASFTIGTKNTPRTVGSASPSRRCDLNNDGRVNLSDFSIMAFWYKRTGFPAKIDLNNDGKINLTDLSILAYCWTG